MTHGLARTAESVRDAAEKDLPRIEEILSASPEAAPAIFRSSGPADAATARILVAERGGIVCGLAIFRCIVEESELLNLAVDFAARRQGVASELVQQVITECAAAGVRQIFLEVRESNAAARAFYERIKFRETGRRRSYYRNPVDDAVLLARTVE